MAYNRDFIRHDSPMDAKYRQPCAQRWHTFKAALSIASQRVRSEGGIWIMETGCVREPNDWGGGMSTVIFGDYCSRYGGQVVTIDNSAEHLARCEKLTAEYGTLIRRVEADSAVFLADDAWGFPVDLLYLDALDYPYGKLMDLYGGKTDIAKAQAVLAAMPEAEIVQKHGHIIMASQEHALAEVQAARASGILGDRTVLLIDDASIPGGGKARLANQWLAANGWECVLEDYQVLWVRA